MWEELLFFIPQVEKLLQLFEKEGSPKKIFSSFETTFSGEKWGFSYASSLERIVFFASLFPLSKKKTIETFTALEKKLKNALLNYPFQEEKEPEILEYCHKILSLLQKNLSLLSYSSLRLFSDYQKNENVAFFFLDRKKEIFSILDSSFFPRFHTIEKEIQQQETIMWNKLNKRGFSQKKLCST